VRLQGMPQSDSPNWAPGAPFHSDTAAASAMSWPGLQASAGVHGPYLQVFA
jgi:hypothetical protein